MDDFSDDRRTRRVLAEEASLGSRVLQPTQSLPVEKRGGLHWNMQYVWDEHITTRFALFMQDDQQIVRPVDTLDENNLLQYFNQTNLPPYLNVTFYDNVLYTGHPLTPDELAQDRAFTERNFSSVSLSFRGVDGPSDTGLWDIDRAKALGFRFGRNEDEVKRNGLALFGPCHHVATPFLAFLPTPLSYRMKRITVIRRLWYIRHAGLHPIDDLSGESVERLRKNIGTLALGHEFLYSPTYGRAAPWPALPMEDAPEWLVSLDRREQAARFWIDKAVRALLALLRLSAPPRT